MITIVGSECDVEIRLKSGTYTFDAPLDLNAIDSRTSIVGSAGDTIFDGGIRVSQWKPMGTNADVLTAPLPPALSNAAPRQLYVGGVLAQTPSAFPNASHVMLTNATGALVTADGFVTSSTAPLRWFYPAGVEVSPPALK